jgi:hypothetical protein
MLILFGLFFVIGLVCCGLVGVGLAIRASGKAKLRQIEKEQGLPPGYLDP